MNKQDERAVESMCRCGLSLDAIVTCFPQFTKKEIKTIFDRVKEGPEDQSDDSNQISMNCS